MKRIITRIALCLFLATSFAGTASVVSGPVASAELTPNQQAVCESIGSGKDCVETDDQGGTRVDSVIKTIVNLLGIVAGILAVIMIIVAGIKYITSSGDSSKITSAKNALVYALVGLVIVALSQVIVRFVLGQTSKSLIKCPTGQVVSADGKCVTKN